MVSEPVSPRDGAGDIERQLLNSTGEGIHGVDLDGKCTFANPACVTLLGFESDEELLGRNMHELVHHTRPNGEPYPMVECKIYQAFRAGEGVHVDDELMWCEDGSSFPAEYWSYPVEQDGELVGESTAQQTNRLLPPLIHSVRRRLRHGGRDTSSNGPSALPTISTICEGLQH